MSFISTVPVNAAGPVANTLPVAVMQAMGAAGANPTAKLLLPQAVTAAVLVPSFANEATRGPIKTLPRLTTNQPVSALTAQLLAQSADIPPEDDALSAPPLQTNAQQAAPQANANTTSTAAQPRTGEAVPTAATPQQASNTPQAATPVAATVLPFVAPATSDVFRKPINDNAGTQSPSVQNKERANSNAVRGNSAYQAATRMHGEKSQYAIEAVG